MNLLYKSVCLYISFNAALTAFGRDFTESVGVAIRNNACVGF